MTSQSQASHGQERPCHLHCVLLSLPVLTLEWLLAWLFVLVSPVLPHPLSPPQPPYTAPSWLILEALQPQRELPGALLPGGIKREQHKMFLLCGAIILNFLDRFAGNYSYLHVCAGVLRTENRTPSLVSNLLLPLFLPD